MNPFTIATSVNVPVTLFALLAVPAAAAAAQPTAITVQLGPEDSASFRVSERVTTEINLHVSGTEYSVPLQCAGGLHDVHVETAMLIASRGEQGKAEGSFALMFDIGTAQDRKFGKLPRVQLSFGRRRLTDMLVTTMTSEQSSFSSHLCSPLPVGPITCKDTRQLQGLAPDALVEQLRDLPAPIPAHAPMTEAESKRRNIYEELLEWEAKSIPSLVAGLRDSDLRLRRNVALAFGVLSGGWWPFECGSAKIDISPALPALVVALRDSDALVRAWAAQAVGSVGTNAADAVPALTELLGNGDEGSRNSACMALGQIGPAARTALPALRAALSDTSQTVRRFAAQAIQRIEQH